MAYKSLKCVFPQTTLTDDTEKSTVSHTVLTCSKQHLHNKKRRPYREHQCGADQIPSEGHVRTFHNFRVLELEGNYAYLG